MGLEEYWESPVAIGQWGGHAGGGWDDGDFGGIRQIIVGHGANIDSVQFEYDVDGRSVLVGKHGGDGGTIDKINLSYPNEVLISISGYVGLYNSSTITIIRSLTFETNVRKYGPFGQQQGMHFTLPAIGGKIVGFYGKSGLCIDSIGVYYKPLKMTKKPNPSESLIPAHEMATANTEVNVNVLINYGLDI